MALSGQKRRLDRGPAAGFTLVELLVVMGVMAILAGILLGVGETIRTRSRRDTTKLLLDRLEGVLEQYKDSIGHYPDAILASRNAGGPSEPLPPSLLIANSAAARALLNAGAGADNITYVGTTPYVVDLYGNRIRIISGGLNSPGLDIWSPGQDGVSDRNASDPLDTGDDIVNWHGR